MFAMASCPDFVVPGVGGVPNLTSTTSWAPNVPDHLIRSVLCGMSEEALVDPYIFDAWNR